MVKYTPFINLYELFLSIFKKFSSKNFSSLVFSNSNKKDVVQFISRSSWFILLIAIIKSDKEKKKINIWLPSYYCNDPIFLLNKLDIDISFYDVDADFNVNLDSVLLLETKNKFPDIILMCNYFGKPVSDAQQLFFYELKKKYSAWLVQDATHCIDLHDIDSKFSDFTCISPYKFFSLPFGALYLSNSKFLDENSISFLNNEKLTTEYLIKKINKYSFIKKSNFKIFFLWILKSIINFFYFKIKIKKFNEDYYIENINLLPHPKTNYIIKNYIFFKFKKINFLKFRIKKNSLKWKKTLLNLNFIDQKKIIIDETDINANFTPYFLKIKSDAQTISNYYSFLKKKKIPILTWPNLNNEFKRDYNKSNAFKLRNSNIFITLSYQNLPINLKIKKILGQHIDNKKNSNFELTEIQDRRVWENFSYKTDRNNLLQDWDYGSNLSEIKNIAVKRFILKDGSENKCIFQVFNYKKKFFNIFYINRGPIFFHNILEDEKSKIVSFLFSIFNNIFRLKFLKFNPELNINSKNIFLINNKNLIFFKEPNWTTSLNNLCANLNEIKAKFKGSVKNDINFFEKKKKELLINVYDNLNHPVPNENNLILEKMYLQDQREKGFDGISINLLRKIINKSNYSLYEVLHKDTGKIIAYGLFYLHYPSATYLLGTFDQDYKKYRSMTYVLFMAIKELKKHNFKYLDLGGIDDLKNKNVAFFKKKFKGQLYTLVGNKTLI